VLTQHGIVPNEPAVIAVGAVVCAGGALFPDLDHPDSTIAHFLGPLSNAFAHVVNVVAGGHRKATHSLLFVIGSWWMIWAAVNFGGEIGALATVFISVALATKGLHLVPKTGLWGWLGTVLIAAAATGIAWMWGPAGWLWLQWAFAIGVALHLVGDALTPGGVPVFWPAKWRLSLPVLPSTGGFVEIKLLTPVMSAAVLWLSWVTVLQPAIAGA
jgi:membrane-bound metal-dependent hydrolase YbcI (DUF457 family)